MQELIPPFVIAWARTLSDTLDQLGMSPLVFFFAFCGVLLTAFHAALEIRKVRGQAWMTAQEIWLEKKFHDKRESAYNGIAGGDWKPVEYILRRVDEMAHIPFLSWRRVAQDWQEPLTQLAPLALLHLPVVRTRDRWKTKWRAAEKVFRAVNKRDDKRRRKKCQPKGGGAMSCRLCEYVKQKWPELFWQLVFVGLGAALGVYWGDVASGRAAQGRADERTHAFLTALNQEALGNTRQAVGVFNTVSTEKTVSAYANMSFSAARAVLLDANLLHVLPPDEVALVEAYAREGERANDLNALYIDLLMQPKVGQEGYLTHIKRGVRSQTVDFLAVSRELMNALSVRTDASEFLDPAVRKRNERRVASIQATREDYAKRSHLEIDIVPPATPK